MGNKIITISREFGSGGRTVGKLAAEKLGIPCYDQEIIEKIAQESGMSTLKAPAPVMANRYFSA